MTINTVTEAKAHLSALIERVSHGEEVIIHRAGKPVAVLEPYRPEHRPRTPGRLRGKVRMAPDFDELPPALAEAFGMRTT
jgi:prevent-host-death family protein